MRISINKLSIGNWIALAGVISTILIGITSLVLLAIKLDIISVSWSISLDILSMLVGGGLVLLILSLGYWMHKVFFDSATVINTSATGTESDLPEKIKPSLIEKAIPRLKERTTTRETYE